jgi:hypothetical protein
MNSKQPIEQRLIAAGEGKGTNESFVLRTMQKIKSASAGALFDAALTPPKRRSLWQRYIHLPKYAMLAIAFGTCALVSGTAYAAYSLWLSPSAQVRSVQNKYGRDQALISLKNCSGSDSKVTVEITKGSTGTPEGAAASELARCELQAVQSWAMRNLHADPSTVMFALVVQKTSANSITTTFSGSADETTYTVPSGTPVIFQGKAIRLSDLRKGDAAVVVTTDHKTAKAVVKMSVPAIYYASDEVNNAYHDRQPCYGNGTASCINLPNLDVLRSGEGGANPDYHGAAGYEIQGKLVSYTPSAFVLEATDGARYTVHTDSDVIGAFNSGNPYQQGVTINPGDVLMVMYEQPKGGNPKDIQPRQYHEIQLMLQGFSKKASTAENMQKYHY